MRLLDIWIFATFLPLTLDGTDTSALNYYFSGWIIVGFVGLHHFPFTIFLLFLIKKPVLYTSRFLS